MRIILALILCTVAHNGLIGQCVTNVNNIVSFNGPTKNYEVVKENLNWLAANNCAVQRGGRLAVIESQQEQDSLFAYLTRSSIVIANTVAPDGGGASYVWIGANDRTNEGTWLWSNYGSGTGQFWQGARTGTVIGGLYNNWGNEPDNFNNQDAAGIALSSWPFGSAGEWNDVDESNTLYYVIEYSNTTGIAENNFSEGIKTYPNPINDNFYIDCVDCKAEEVFIQILSIEGKVLIEKEQVLKNAVNLSLLPEGIYFLRIGDKRELKKLIKVD